MDSEGRGLATLVVCGLLCGCVAIGKNFEGHPVSAPTADFPNHDSVGTHPEGVADKLADPNFTTTLEVGGTTFQRDDMVLLELKLRRVFDRDDALLGGNER
jgi:hypothetical protein